MSITWLIDGSTNGNVTKKTTITRLSRTKTETLEKERTHLNRIKPNKLARI